MLSNSIFILLPNSILAKSSHALALPIPFIFNKFSIFIFFRSLKLFNVLNIELAKYLTEWSLVPVLSIIDNNSSLDKFSTPLLINLSLGLSLSGISLIVIISLSFIFF
jgi:hypothetical protein